MTAKPTISHHDWTLYDASGYIQRYGVEVRDYKDDTISIGVCLYPAWELAVSEDGSRIDSLTGGGWYLRR